MLRASGTWQSTDPQYPSNIYLFDDQTPEIALAENQQTAERGLDRTVAALRNAGKQVVIIGPVPEASTRVSAAMARAMMLGVHRNYSRPLAEINGRLRRTITILLRVGGRRDARVLFPHQVLCFQTKCIVEEDRVPLYFDEDHLSAEGALFVGEGMARIAKVESAFF